MHLAEVQAFDAEGELIAPSGAEMHSFGFGVNAEFHVPGNCIDGDLDTICHSAGDGTEEFLRVDFVVDVGRLSTISVANMASCCQSRIVGAKVHVAMGRPGSNAEAREVAVWTGEIEGGAPEYTFEPTSEITC